MTRRSKTLMLVASLILIGAYFLPIWEISLEAPQYPEGLGLKIWINAIGGQNQGDLNKVNNLNHYIGMKKIIPEAIPELKIMPFVIGLMIILGLLTAFSGKRMLLYIWTVLFIIIGIAGMVDFYLWEYDYGHNLNPDAAIKIPGMNYQPPLIGSKQLLNFNAISLPGAGGYLVFLSMTLGILALFWEFKNPRKKNEVASHENKLADKMVDSDFAGNIKRLRTVPESHTVWT